MYPNKKYHLPCFIIVIFNSLVPQHFCIIAEQSKLSRSRPWRSLLFCHTTTRKFIAEKKPRNWFVAFFKRERLKKQPLKFMHKSRKRPAMYSMVMCLSNGIFKCLSRILFANLSISMQIILAEGFFESYCSLTNKMMGILCIYEFDMGNSGYYNLITLRRLATWQWQKSLMRP